MQEEEETAVMTAINKEFRKYLSNPENVENSANSLLDDLIDDAIMSVVFQIDIARKTQMDAIINGETNSDNFQIVDVNGFDVFGQSTVEKNHECLCPCCNRTMAASRFAPHLAKSMGRGRNSSRIARNRIANNANTNKDTCVSSGVISDDDDEDWTVMTEKKGKKKRERIPVKKVKSSKLKNGNSNTDGGSNSASNNISYESMPDRDRRVLFNQICGVISEHTKRVCTKSVKCPQHTEEQKKNVRDLYSNDTVDTYLDNLQIDVDTYEEDVDLAKETLVRSWEAEHSNTSSPADSASTSSSSSKKRDKSSYKMKIKD